jgi:hypothetical protein
LDFRPQVLRLGVSYSSPLFWPTDDFSKPRHLPYTDVRVGTWSDLP